MHLSRQENVIYIYIYILVMHILDDIIVTRTFALKAD
jgi:hypothetical protein